MGSATPQQPQTFVLVDTQQFEFHANNYGKTSGRVFKIGWGFCEKSAVPNIDPIYTEEYINSWINPGASGVLLDQIPIPSNLAEPTIFGRIYYETIFDQRFSIGFVYSIPAQPRDSKSIRPPNPRYTEERKEE